MAISIQVVYVLFGGLLLLLVCFLSYLLIQKARLNAFRAKVESYKDSMKESFSFTYTEKMKDIGSSLKIKESGFHVRYFNNGEDALNSIHQQKPEVVVLDIMLGENKLDGWDVLRHLKENTETEKIPILISSALDERSKGLELGVCEFLIKPYQLVNYLKRFSSCF
ncbi:response regulator [Priestia aryabhattai]|uniref:response regulator n=1 Tax=Priestia megaterium TaxID=1404 RepID=UPI0039B96D59